MASHGCSKSSSLFKRWISIRVQTSRSIQKIPTGRRSLSVKELWWCAAKDSPNRRPGGRFNVAAEEQYKPIQSFGIIAAMSKANRVIGVNGKIPWDLPEDRAYFKNLTKNQILVIGRRTLEEEPSLCHISHASHTIVVSKSLASDSAHSGYTVARSFPEALHVANGMSKSVSALENHVSFKDIPCWIAGGERLYNEAILHPSAECIHLTVVDKEVDIANCSDFARFPVKYRWDNRFKEVFKEELVAKEGEVGLSFSHYVFQRLGRRERREAS